MIQNFLHIIGLVLLSANLLAQPHHTEVYALVVGISNYENPGIEDLEFATRDAEEFSKYLKSEAGGLIQEDHITLLLNEQATYGALYLSLDSITDKCNENDLVYIYFSGHGDLENNTIYNLGFLLSYNTPRNNYFNQALRIEDLNNYANTISLKKKAKIIIITDACHSGKLAGSEYLGSFLVGDQLRKVQNNEIRITSCDDKQLSAEDIGWGEGRGVFSYYLIQGLEGLADVKNDGQVTVDEIQTYLHTSLANDALLKQKQMVQTPVVKGNLNFQLAKTIQKNRDSLLAIAAEADAVQVVKPVSIQNIFFDYLEQEEIEGFFNFKMLQDLSAEEIPFEMIRTMEEILQLADDTNWSKFKTVLEKNPDAKRRFKTKLVETISNRGQQIINLYLSSDEEELERRRYYNAAINDYDKYPSMFAVATKLLPESSALKRILEIHTHYFTGLAARLKLPIVTNPLPYIDTALSEQLQALALEPDAAYILNELGILYKIQKNYDKADSCYTKASKISPTWAIPWSNLAGLYLLTGDLQKANESAYKSIALQPNLPTPYNSAGKYNVKQHNYLFAEEMFRKSIQLNDKHFLPYQELGLIYIATGNYGLANSFLKASADRQKGFNLAMMDSDQDGIPDFFLDTDENALSFRCELPSNINEQDVVGLFLQAMSYFNSSSNELAEKTFKQVIKVDKKHPLVYYYLGELYQSQQRYDEAEIMFKFAAQNILTHKIFLSYPKQGSKNSVLKIDCLKKKWLGYYFEESVLYFKLGKLYEQWNHIDEAEATYYFIINKFPIMAVKAYLEIETLYEKLGRFHEAEGILIYINQKEPQQHKEELISFYDRVTRQFPSSFEWHYKAGNYFYQTRAKNTNSNISNFTTNKFIQLTAFNYEAPASLTHLKSEDDRHSIDGLDFNHEEKKAITYLQKALRLSKEETLQVEINQKLGNLFKWQGLNDSSIAYFQKALQANDHNANTRHKLIEMFIPVFEYRLALEQLDSLHHRNEMNYEHQMLFTRYCIHAGRYDEAAVLLKQTKTKFQLSDSTLFDMENTLAVLSNQLNDAILVYKKQLQLTPNNNQIEYVLARVYALQSNKEQALQWLELAIKHGFTNYYVLKFDTSWTGLNSSDSWKKALESLSAFAE